MSRQPVSFEHALKQYDRKADQADVEAAENERQEILRRFPLESWPTLTLERYAIGRENYKDTFCWLVEFGTPHLGSVKGGSARKHLIYWKREGGWYFDTDAYRDEQDAWSRVRAGFLDAFETASRNEWDTIDGIEALTGAAALRVKALHAYFPQQLLPVCSTAHIRHFLKLLGHPAGTDSSYEAVRLNRALLAKLRETELLTTWTTKEIERFLYSWASPAEGRRIVKIAPGPNAEFWNDCLEGGYICAGWDEIGDLTQFESKEAFETRYPEVFGRDHNWHKPTIAAQAKQLWTLRDLEPGDLVVANRGMSQVLAVGEVIEPGYEFMENRPKYKQVVHVKWDTSYAKEISLQRAWRTTLVKVSQALAAQILSKGAGGSGGSVPPEPLWVEIAGALERKGQAILYGPPGTGKTYEARRFAVWWLLCASGESNPETIVADPKRLIESEKRLSDDGALTHLTFHASYSYEDFIEGIRPASMGNGAFALTLEPGVFNRICKEAAAHPAKVYLVVIDEINRANVGKVFGEIITLLEKDKRGLPITLPQSKERFTIPSNIYVLGTMNTADRSIKLLDAALRRRFAFLERMPDSSLLSGKVGSLRLDLFLDGLNRRIAEREGREKQIGHSFLLDADGPVTDPKEFARRFQQDILPLLQEYCYEDYSSLAHYLGDTLVDRNGQVLNEDLLSDPDRLVETLEAEFGPAGASD